MSEHFHYLVWIDHERAKIMNFNADEVVSSVVRSTRGNPHIHHKANAGDSGHLGIDADFMERIAHTLKSAGAIVIVGPASAKNKLAQHIRHKHTELAKRLSGVETLGRSTDGELVAFGRRFFRADDRMRPQEHRTQG